MRIGISVLAIAAISATSFTAQPRPDFSGTWVLDTAVLGRQTGYVEGERGVKQTDSTIWIRQLNVTEQFTAADTLLLRFDGSIVRQPGANGVVRLHSAKWAGDTLVLTTHAESPTRKWDDMRRWTLAGERMLRIDQVVFVDGKKVREEGAVFRRQ